MSLIVSVILSILFVFLPLFVKGANNSGVAVIYTWQCL